MVPFSTPSCHFPPMNSPVGIVTFPLNEGVSKVCVNVDIGSAVVQVGNEEV